MIRIVKKEKILCLAFALAFISMFIVLPDWNYVGYVDYETLTVLFCLMCVMAGLQKSGVFQYVAQILLSTVSKTWQLVLTLVLLCFFSSMVVTNDVALITFVPFTLTVLAIIGPEAKKALVIPIVVLQTIAANLGSMFTPIGNPQNLYLYTKASLSLVSFISLMFPYVLVSFLIIIIWCWIQSRPFKEPIRISFKSRKKDSSWNKIHLALYAVLFVLDLLTVARIIPYGLTLIISILVIFLMDKKIFLDVDYSLLLTFVGFFIFIGNIERLPSLSQLLQNIVSGNEILVSVVISQVISNLPAALLLSRFTQNLSSLIIGVNLGGLGTLIASMASLISYKFIVEEEEALKGKYFKYFTVANIFFLLALLLFSLFTGKINLFSL